MSKKTRGFVFTINNYDEHDEHVVFSLVHEHGAKYVSCGREVGASGTRHLQGYVYFTTPRAFGGVKSIMPNAHIETAKTIDEAIVYTQKEGNFYEEGVKPMSQNEKGECGKRSAEERWQLAKAGRFELLPPECIRSYEHIYRTYGAPAQNTFRDRGLNYWIIGEPNSGKTTYVKRTYQNLYQKKRNKWWDLYDPHIHDTVLIDEMSPQFPKELVDDFKEWTDGTWFMAEIKCGTIKVQPMQVIVCSNYTIEHCFGYDLHLCNAINTRFTVVYFSKEDRTKCGIPLPWATEHGGESTSITSPP